MSTVESLRGTTPAEIFTDGLENVEQIEAVALSVLWRDGTVTSGWSNVTWIRLLAETSVALSGGAVLIT